MKIGVMFHSLTGNTKKIAEAIAEQAGVQAESIAEDSCVQDVDLLFIGDGIYAGKPHAATQKLLSSIHAGNVAHVAIFGTYGGQKKAIEQMKATLKKQGVDVFDASFGCKGRAWLVANRAHPSEEDIAQAKQFAKQMIAKCNP